MQMQIRLDCADPKNAQIRLQIFSHAQETLFHCSIDWTNSITSPWQWFSIEILTGSTIIENYCYYLRSSYPPLKMQQFGLLHPALANGVIVLSVCLCAFEGQMMLKGLFNLQKGKVIVFVIESS